MSEGTDACTWGEQKDRLPIRLFDGGCGSLSPRWALGSRPIANAPPGPARAGAHEIGAARGRSDTKGSPFAAPGSSATAAPAGGGHRSQGRACASTSGTWQALGLGRSPARGTAGQGGEVHFPGRPVGLRQRSGWRAVTVPGRERANETPSGSPSEPIGRFSGRRTVALSTSWSETERPARSPRVDVATGTPRPLERDRAAGSGWLLGNHELLHRRRRQVRMSTRTRELWPDLYLVRGLK